MKNFKRQWNLIHVTVIKILKYFKTSGCKKWRNRFKIEICVVIQRPYQKSGNHSMKPSTFGHLISERQWKSTFNFTEIVNNYGLKWVTLCQFVIFTSHVSLRLYIQFWNYFHSMVLRRLGRDYCKKICKLIGC